MTALHIQMVKLRRSRKTQTGKNTGNKPFETSSKTLAFSQISYFIPDLFNTEIRIPLERAGRLHQGLTAEFLGDGKEPISTSEIASIERTVDEGTQSILAKAAYSNVENGLLNTQFVRARVIWNENPGLLIPTSAISRIGGQTFVYVAEPPVDPETNEVGDGLIAAQTPVSLGAIQEQSYHVISGLESGDRIVTSGILKLQNNVPIVELPSEDETASAES